MTLSFGAIARRKRRIEGVTWVMDDIVRVWRDCVRVSWLVLSRFERYCERGILTESRGSLAVLSIWVSFSLLILFRLHKVALCLLSGFEKIAVECDNTG